MRSVAFVFYKKINMSFLIFDRPFVFKKKRARARNNGNLISSDFFRAESLALNTSLICSTQQLNALLLFWNTNTTN